MIRLIILLVLASLAVLLLQKLRSSLRLQQRKPTTRNSGNQTEEKISKCKTCGLHVPQSSGLEYQDKFFCSEAHKLAYIENQKENL